MRWFVIITLLFTVIPALAQKQCSRVKGYAYQRSVLPGMIPQRSIEEDGSVKAAQPPAPNFYFYVEFPSNKQLTAVRAWIRGKAYNITVSPVGEVPVVIPKTPLGNQPRMDTLVGKTNNNLLRIQPTSPIEVRSSGRLQKRISTNELVIEYEMNDKDYVLLISTIKKLEPLALQ